MTLENRIVKHIGVTGFSGGGGKSHILKRILELSPDHVFSTSTTTRLPRGEEIHGVDYNFVDEATFINMLKNGEFVEYSNPKDGIYYGTTKAECDRIIASGKAIAFDVDYKGIVHLRENPLFTPESFCVIVPWPDAYTRHRWMIKRGDMSDVEIAERLYRSETKERPFLEDETNSHLFDLVLRPYNETLPKDGAFIASIIANHINYGTPLDELK